MNNNDNMVDERVATHVRREFVDYNHSLNKNSGKTTQQSSLSLIANTFIDPNHIKNLPNMKLLPIDIIALPKLASQSCNDAELFAIYLWQQLYNESKDLQKPVGTSNHLMDQDLESIQRNKLELYRDALKKVMKDSDNVETKHFAQFLLAHSLLTSTDKDKPSNRNQGLELLKSLLEKRELDPKLQITAQNAFKIYNKQNQQLYAPQYTKEFVLKIFEIMDHEKSKPELFKKILKMRKDYADTPATFFENILNELLDLTKKSGVVKQARGIMGMKLHSHDVSTVIYDALSHINDIGADTNGLRMLEKYLVGIRPQPLSTPPIGQAPPTHS